MDYNEIIKFSTTVFNHYNGYINAGSLCILIFSPLQFNGYASYKLPNIITVYPYNIINDFKKEDHIKTIILFSILHELSHSVQDIDFNKYFYDSSYNKDIEDSNNFRITKYILDNRDYIENIFKFNLNIPYIENTYNNIKYTKYNDIGSYFYKYNQIFDYFKSKGNYTNNFEDVLYLLDDGYQVYINIFSTDKSTMPIMIHNGVEFVDNFQTIANIMIYIGITESCNFNTSINIDEYNQIINIEILNLNRHAIIY